MAYCVPPTREQLHLNTEEDSDLFNHCMYFFFVNYQYLFGAELEWYLFSLCTAVALMQALVRFI